MTDFKGVPFRLGGKEVAASNGRIHPELQQISAELAAQSAPLY